MYTLEIFEFSSPVLGTKEEGGGGVILKLKMINPLNKAGQTRHRRHCHHETQSFTQIFILFFCS